MTSPAPVPSSSGARKRAAVGAALAGLAAAVALLVARSPHPSPAPAPIPTGSYWTCSATDSVLVDAARTPSLAFDRRTGVALHVGASVLSSAADPMVFGPAQHLAQPCTVGPTDFAVPATAIARLGDSIVVILPDTAQGKGLVRLPDTVLVIPPLPPVPPPAVPTTPIT